MGIEKDLLGFKCIPVQLDFKMSKMAEHQNQGKALVLCIWLRGWSLNTGMRVGKVMV